MALLRPIFLTQDQVAYVDADLWPELNAVKWCAWWNPHTRTFYARRYAAVGPRRQVTEQLHRRILGCTHGDGKLVDHRNGDTLMNSRANLRLATASGNALNSRRRSDNKSGIPGVHWHQVTGKWQVEVGHEYIGTASDPEEARQMRDEAIKARGLVDWVRH